MRSYVLRIVGIFALLLVVYLLIACFILWPMGYYGTLEQPRFADPWIARVETILGGGMLYRDVFTTTPPLMNFLLIPPVLFSGLFDHRNPWATLSFMVYFSLFNLFAALVLLAMAKDRREGYHAALLFLLNPLTFGNSLLRRQDESILAFFFALALLFMLHGQHGRGSLLVGLSMLVKLSGALLLPVALLHTRNWRYLVIPPLVFGLAVAPFLLLVGREAMFWDPVRPGTEHPFQLRGVSLSALWHGARGTLPTETAMAIYSGLFVVAVLAALGLIAWKPQGLFEDMTLLTTAVLLFSPKLHCGYFSLLVLTMAPLVRRYRLAGFYFLFSLLALIADVVKWPIVNLAVAFVLMAAVCVTLLVAAIWLRVRPAGTEQAA